MDDYLTIIQGDALEKLRGLPAESVQCCVTSPPYWGLRDYSTNGQLGLEKTPDEYVAKMVEIFREVWRTLRPDGVLFLNLGDSYTSGGRDTRDPSQSVLHPAQQKGMKRAETPLGLKPKDLCGIPWRLAFALQADGWYLRQDIIWHKPNPMPESVTDRCTKAHEYIFLLTKSIRYFYDAEAIKEKDAGLQGGRQRAAFEGNQVYADSDFKSRHVGNGHSGLNCQDYTGTRNKRSVWTIATQPYPEAHFATFPEELPKLCILAGTKPGDSVLDPFAGSGTTGAVALELGRSAILIELNPKYAELIEQRCQITIGLRLC
jgi:DNA modification methylase